MNLYEFYVTFFAGQNPIDSSASQLSLLKIYFLEKVALRRQQDQEELGLVQNEVSQREEAQLVTSRKRAHEDLQPYPNGKESMPLNNGRGNYTFLDPKLILKYLTLISQIRM